MKELVRKCPICSNNLGECLHTQKFANLEQSTITNCYEVVACQKCGFVYADTKSLQTDYDKYYEYMSKYQDIKSTGSGNDQYDITRLKESTKVISKYMKNKDASILDMGCANGGLLYQLKEIGYTNLQGIDPSEICVNHTIEKGIRARRGSIFNQGRNKKYDCIILTHVLEHIRDLQQALTILKNMLHEDGILYIELPNAGQYKECYIVPFYYFDCEHINHFDKLSIQNALYDLKCLYIEEVLQALNSKIVYPVLKCVFRKTKDKDNQIEYSKIGMESIVKYIQLSKKMTINKDIELMVKSKEPIIIWGAGQYALRLLANTDLVKCNIIGFIDSDGNKQENTINGIQIYSQEIISKFNGTIVIAAALASTQIKDELEKMCVNNKIILL